MEDFFGGKTAIFSKKVPSEILFEWRTSQFPISSRSSHTDTHGGKLYYAAPRKKNEFPDYYFTPKTHTNFYH
jgi:hypothetical protein